jgi:lipopolysaccharide/colanic/teichoic acid biosynthesis glycosyltransferase
MSAMTQMTLATYDRAQGSLESSTEGEPVSEPDFPALGVSARSTAKRIMDVVGSFCGLVLLAPILALVALCVRLESKGPILFRQKRMGLRGRTFWCLKFRTMVPDAEQRLKELEARNESAGGVLFKIKDDPRVTPLGRFLRRTSLDEFPQLWNVLMGEMSLVGPRPLQLRDSEKLARFDPDGYVQRLTVLPGLTGPWQVGGRSEVDSGRMLRLDLDYVERWSIGVDLEILVKTVVVVCAGRGAC